MDKNKRLAMMMLFAAVLVLALYYVSMDWITLLQWDRVSDYPGNRLVRTLKFFSVVLCAVNVWLIGKDGFSIKDKWKLRTAFIFLVFGDLSLYLGYQILGVLVYGIGQIILIVRHLTGFGGFIKSGGASKHKFALWAYIILLAIAWALSMVFIFYPLLKGTTMLYMIGGYAILLSLSLWAALVSPFMGLLPKKNAVFTVIGIACFYFSDMAVGVAMALDSGFYDALSSALIWILFVPVIILLALSGCDLNKLFTLERPEVHQVALEE